MTATDAELIEASLRVPEKFALLFDRHAPHIQRYLARRLGQQIADDLLAETFLAAFTKRERYDSSRPDARPWLYGIATNLVGQHRREEVRRHRTPPAGPYVADHADRVAADVTAQAMRSMLSGALGALSVEDRDVLLLVAWEQLSYLEVAEALAVPVGTVRSRLNRARRKVRAALGTDNHTEVEELLNNG